jgi:AP-1 complex subunit mu
MVSFFIPRFENDRTISFIPPDGEFELMSYRLNTHVKPLIWIESVIERHDHSRCEIGLRLCLNAVKCRFSCSWLLCAIDRLAESYAFCGRIEIMVKAKSQFKRRSTANNVEVVIPVPSDADSPKFKTTIGKSVKLNLNSRFRYILC